MNATETKNAQDFANEIDHPVVFLVGNGCPAGQTIAILPDTELPIDLSEAEGEVKDGSLEVTNLKCGDGIRDWRFSDHNGNLYYRISVSEDNAEWVKQAIEFATGDGCRDRETLEAYLCGQCGISKETFEAELGDWCEAETE